MGNKPSRAVVPLEPGKGYIPTKRTCTVPDTTVIDRRIYQIELIDRATDIIERVIQTGISTSDYVSAQTDALNYKNPEGIDDPEKEVVVQRRVVKYRHHQWSILLDDPVLVGRDRKNPFELFKTPLDGNLPVDVVQPLFKNYLKRFNEAKLAAIRALRQECVTK